MNKKIILFLFIILIIALSFFRESVFVNINAHMWYLFYENDKSFLAPSLSFLSPLSYKQLYWFKWGLTVFFSLLFLILSCAVIYTLFKGKKFIYWTIYSFLALFFVSAAAYFGGHLLNNSEKGYLISRFFMGMIQSPFILIFLIPAFKLAEADEVKNTK